MFEINQSNQSMSQCCELSRSRALSLRTDEEDAERMIEEAYSSETGSNDDADRHGDPGSGRSRPDEQRHDVVAGEESEHEAEHDDDDLDDAIAKEARQYAADDEERRKDAGHRLAGGARKELRVGRRRGR